MTKDVPSVAVVITTFEQARFLRSAIQSALAQSSRPAEIVVVDDGSSDAPEAIVGEFPGVRIVRQANRGLPAARNRGIASTRSPFLLFLDADDRLLPAAIATGLATLQQDEEAAFCYGSYRTVDAPSGLVKAVPLRRVARDAFADFLHGNAIGMHAAVLYRRAPLEQVHGFDEGLRACEDYDLYLRLSRAWPIRWHDDDCADYYLHGANMSGDPVRMLKAALGVLQKQTAEAERRGFGAVLAQGKRGWRRYYIDRWAAMRDAPWARAQTGVSLITLAPVEMFAKLAAAAARRSRLVRR